MLSARKAPKTLHWRQVGAPPVSACGAPVDVITKQSGAQQHATNQRSTDELNTLSNINRHEGALILALR